MLNALVGDSKDLKPLKRLIIEKTEGNPFFIEEMVQVLLDNGALVSNGTVRITKPLNELKIPPTVQAILAARIDRLPGDQKDLLQTLAVAGKEFRLGLIRKVVAKSEQELDRMLSELQFAEFIYEQPAADDVEYTFKHALTHDVAYDSLLMERRRLLHGRIGAALESLFDNNVDEHVVELARHYARSSNPSKAVEYCLRSCEQCTERASYAEAVAHFETGYEMLQKLPDDDRRAELELDLRIAAGLAIGTTKGMASPEYRQSSGRAMELAQRPHINWEKSWLVLFTASAAALSLDIPRACEICTDMVARALLHGSSEQIGTAEVRAGSRELPLLCGAHGGLSTRPGLQLSVVRSG